MHAILALAIKDIRQLLRDRSNAFFTFAFPLLLAVFFGVVFRGVSEGGSGITVVVVNQDGGEAAARLVEQMQEDSALLVSVVESRAEGEAQVRRGKATACIVVPEGFSAGVDSIFAGGSMRIEMVVDPSRGAAAGLLTGKMNELCFEQLSGVMGDTDRLLGAVEKAKRQVHASDSDFVTKGMMSVMFDSIANVARNADAGGGEESGGGGGGGLGGWRPVEVTMRELKDESVRPRSSYEISFTQGVVWGLLGCVTAFGLSMAFERARGTLLRLSVAPITRGHILAGKALSCFVACMAVQGMLLAMGVLVFGVGVDSPLKLAVAFAASSVGFTGVMMLLAGLSKTEGAGAGMGRAVVLVLAMIGGGTVPLFFLPQFMQTASKISPFTWATLAIEGAVWRGHTWGEMAVPLAVLGVFGVAGFAIGTMCLKWTHST
jgi:ABC-2 type transport system permease protein